MAEAVPVATNGFGVPPVPATATASSNTPPPPANQTPGFAPPAPPAGLTADDVKAQIEAALKAAQPQPVPQPAPVVPSTSDFQLGVDGTADPVLNSLTDVFLKVGRGIDLERAVGNALAFGQVDLIDNAYIREKGGEHAEQLATLAKAIVERVATESAAAEQAAYQAAGDKAQWDAAAAVFDKNAPQHLKMVVAKMLDSGNREAISAAAKTVVEYVQQKGLVVTPAQLLHAGSGAGGAGQALSKAEFQDALFKLDPNSRGYIEARNTLYQRRALGKQLGK